MYLDERIYSSVEGVKVSWLVEASGLKTVYKLGSFLTHWLWKERDNKLHHYSHCLNPLGEIQEDLYWEHHMGECPSWWQEFGVIK